MRSLTTMLLAFVSPAIVFAQTNDSTVAMAEGMRSNGKIYVVVAVLCLILAGIAVYLIRLDRKITRLEKNTEA